MLFTELPWPVLSEGTFRSLSQAAICLSHTVEASHFLFIAERQAGKLWIPKFLFFGFDPTENQTRVYRFITRCSHSTSHLSRKVFLGLFIQQFLGFSLGLLANSYFADFNLYPAGRPWWFRERYLPVVEHALYSNVLCVLNSIWKSDMHTFLKEIKV